METDLRSLETSEMVLVQEDHSENHSSTSDIIHLEAELHERAESDDEEDLQSSVLSMICSDRELVGIESAAESDLKPPQTGELLMCVEEPVVEETETEVDSEPFFTHTPLLSEPLDFTMASLPIPEIISQVLDHLPHSAVTQSEESHTSESSNEPSVSQDHTTSSSEEVVSKAGLLPTSPFELPLLLVGVAALVAVVGVLTYKLSRK
ncbi:uncharacterized protein si:ch211-214j24.14 [Rhinichthys klamathensis goyatoka]|uniref:uncharacterized protein si:ch211-214j24.14 n=1 Tax=Rhinichthys klamathensis goyatoka TaxID=3034132 RepID=UPI0024B55021|nr:uncharacterized protein si:ch211-214j24.14 [Rhinichthys klamathensis goyatoka]